ncbi:hypothetical protein AD006_30100 (plasmid) [Pseudonocardia sp. EC080610-09]|uniref:2-phosphosulfolactate phosphatase n=1 Tax=unclassified Pseudonocardia TaxID=2619320 RepID=UPI00070670EF|nr:MULTISPECIES: 2-phosphosulfolactate phosphatase [unclassified Pseudonocardia]ALL79494.1 hypothetical protein AD006_30100 [Pseudonocardia sp. EC080610-09]ALL85553.1 hypothetical protein AD017_31150 [Pseudonocardia sp. EC080619-01]
MTPSLLSRIGSQAEFAVRMEWGTSGAAVVTEECEFAVVVDVLSFTTTLSVACDLGIAVVPCPWRDERAADLARRHDATLAAGRSQARSGQVSLSPSTLSTAGPIQRLVLPSPNGSTISAQLAAHGPQVVAAGLRNRHAVAAWLTQQPHTEGQQPRLAIIAAGERWPDGSLRPGIEDLWGAGAVIRALTELGWRGLSPEADVAAAAFDAVADLGIAPSLHRSASGRELAAIGFSHDVDAAAELDHSRSVPILRDGIYTG